MTIRFYLNNAEHTYIYAMCNMVSNPFKVGQKINIKVPGIYPGKRDKTKQIHDLLHNNTIQLITEDITIDIVNDKFVIEYICEIV